MNITAARSFNRGLRSIYFALAALAWLLGPVPLLAVTAADHGGAGRGANSPRPRAR